MTKKQIDHILSMLSWHNDAATQNQGVALAKEIKNLSPFFQPITKDYAKDTWENCAIIICERTDRELADHLPEMLAWLQDMNWPGADRIQQRLMTFSETEALSNELLRILPQILRDKDDIWLENLSCLLKNDRLKQNLPQEAIESFRNKINYDELSVTEKHWIELFLQLEFRYKKEIEQQFLASTIERDYRENGYYLGFSVPRDCPPIPKLSYPVAMEIQICHNANQNTTDEQIYSPVDGGIPFDREEGAPYPTDFLLFVTDGYISSLDIYNLDGSRLDPEQMCLGKLQYGMIDDLRPEGRFRGGSLWKNFRQRGSDSHSQA